MTSKRANQALLDALENERRYAAKELHDGVAQTTLQLSLQARICQKLLDRNDLESLAGELANLEERINRVSNQVRDLIQDLRPPTFDLEQPSLHDFIQYAVDVHQQRGGVFTRYNRNVSDEALQLSADQMLGLMRIVQEALLHVRKRSGAQNVWLTVSIEAHNLYLTMVDDGNRSGPATSVGRPNDQNTEGFSNLQARAEAVGGSLTVECDPDAPATQISVIVPL